MPTVGHNFDDGDVICIDSNEGSDNLDVGGPKNGSKVQQNVPDLSWYAKKIITEPSK